MIHCADSIIVIDCSINALYSTRLDSTRLDYFDYFDYFDGKMARWQDGKASRNFSAFTIFSRKAKKKKAIF